jgi:beta-phosphoglucomutase-like phosphatase (HAD superfamily)
MSLAAARALGVAAAACAVLEDTLAGVAAGRAGGFGFVVGVDRGGSASGLTAHGADVVVADLAELLATS